MVLFSVSYSFVTWSCLANSCTSCDHYLFVLRCLLLCFDSGVVQIVIVKLLRVFCSWSWRGPGVPDFKAQSRYSRVPSDLDLCPLRTKQTKNQMTDRCDEGYASTLGVKSASRRKLWGRFRRFPKTKRVAHHLPR